MNRTLALAALVAASSVAPGSGAFVISVSPPSFRLGPYRVDRAPTYDGALAALGRSSTCTLLSRDRSHARAVWRALGVTIELQTYGALPAGKSVCTAPNAGKVHTVRVVDRRWSTSRGLRVGDSVAKLKSGYASAKPAKALTGWYASGYWLATRRVGGYEGIGGFRPYAPALVAETRGGRIVAFVLVVGAEGD